MSAEKAPEVAEEKTLTLQPFCVTPSSTEYKAETPVTAVTEQTTTGVVLKIPE